MAGDAQGLARVVEKFLPANGISLGQETGKVIEAFSLAGLLGRIGFHGISQVDDRHDVRGGITLVDLVHEPNLFCYRMIAGKPLFISDLVQGIDNGMLQKWIRFCQASL